MQFRRNGGRDDRRRRVLIDDSNEGTSKSSRRKKGSSPKGYTDEARDEHQCHITQLIARRHRVIGLFAFLGALFVAAICGAYTQLATLSESLPNTNFAAFDISSPSNIMVWFSSLLLLSAAMVSIQIYSVRRFKEDDYRGTYRVWLWAAALFVLASLDVATQVHHTAGSVMMHYAGTPLFLDGSIWSLIASAAIFGTLGLRLLIEIRRSKAAVAISLLAGFAFAVTAVFQLDIIAMANPITSNLVHAIAVVSAHGLTLLSICYYARFVHLEAHGQLKSQLAASKPAKKTAAKDEPNSATEEEDAEDKPKLLDQESIDELEELEESFDNAPRTRKRRKQRKARENTDVISMEDEYLEEDEPKWQNKSKRRKQKNRRRAA